MSTSMLVTDFTFNVPAPDVPGSGVVHLWKETGRHYL